MRIIRKYRAAFIYGKAIKSFLNGNYVNAISLFEKILRIEPKHGSKGYARYYLGRSFFAVGNKKKAEEEMAAAYKMLRQRIVSNKNETDVRYFKTLACEYIKLLSDLDEITLAKEIRIDKEKIINL